MALNPDDLVALLAAAGALLTFAVVLLAFGRVARRRYQAAAQIGARSRQRRSAPPVAPATQSLARPQSTTPKIDRVARRWLPRRELLVARLGTHRQARSPSANMR